MYVRWGEKVKRVKTCRRQLRGGEEKEIATARFLCRFVTSCQQDFGSGSRGGTLLSPDSLQGLRKFPNQEAGYRSEKELGKAQADSFVCQQQERTLIGGAKCWRRSSVRKQTRREAVLDTENRFRRVPDSLLKKRSSPTGGVHHRSGAREAKSRR